jgi:hypothetical protein
MGEHDPLNEGASARGLLVWSTTTQAWGARARRLAGHRSVFIDVSSVLVR